MTSGGHEVDVGGVVPDYKYRRNKPESEFLTGQAEYSWSCECLGSCLAVECSMMRSSMLFQVFECSLLLPYVHLASTWHHSRLSYMYKWSPAPTTVFGSSVIQLQEQQLQLYNSLVHLHVVAVLASHLELQGVITFTSTIHYTYTNGRDFPLMLWEH